MLIWLIIKSESDDESEAIEDSGSDYKSDKVSSVSSSSSSDDDEEDSNKPKT